MRPTLFYRIAAILLLLFAAGHTFGFLSFLPASAEGQAVVHAMATPLSEDGARFSYAGFYRGFGLYGGMALLLMAVWAWWLGSLARTLPRATIVPGIAMMLFQLGGLVLALLYFPLPPVIFSAVLVFVLGVAVAGAARSQP
ncbi:MAG TPA: hypothetical protein VK533_11545 [Sphingomonas sp.]|uniref:LIC_13387 family protein n=1 Tax=Sphingomonas sp. TaxID=28214 RepID=UPI002BA22BF9|nr:hypothetical protein [Sphingomonas sp.]HMI20170.1 hypothetical protein [Sphingomonas sp.]